MSTVRRFLDLSTAYLPGRFWKVAADDWSDVWVTVAYPTRYGALLWVPDDPDESSLAQEEPTPAEVLRVQLYARRLGCDYVLLDSDGDDVPEGALPTFDHDALETDHG